MIKVKLSSGKNDQAYPFILQTPNNSLVWKNYQFFIDNEPRNYDYWIVLEEIGEFFEKNQCKKGGLIFIAGEPPTVRDYKLKFLEQFDYVVGLERPNSTKTLYFNTHKFLPWHIKNKYFPTGRSSNEISYNFLRDNHPKKEKSICVICSSKSLTPGHRERIEFVEALRKYFGDKLDVYGLDGFSSSIGLSQYKYHIVVENTSYPHYWSEKIADAYLSECYPIYYGAGNIDAYFSPNSYTLINIKNVNQSINVIAECIASNTFELRYNEILISKQKVLDEYNLFNLIENLKICSVTSSSYKNKIILHERYFSSIVRRCKKMIIIKLLLIWRRIIT